MNQVIYQIDAFTDRSFAGNPAAVCVLPKPREATLVGYQASARGSGMCRRPATASC